MDITLQFPESLGEQLSKLPDPNGFVVDTVEKALHESWMDKKTLEALKRADEGKYADDADVKAFFDTWSDDESKMD